MFFRSIFGTYVVCGVPSTAHLNITIASNEFLYFCNRFFEIIPLCNTGTTLKPFNVSLALWHEYSFLIKHTLYILICNIFWRTCKNLCIYLVWMCVHYAFKNGEMNQLKYCQYYSDWQKQGYNKIRLFTNFSPSLTVFNSTMPSIRHHTKKLKIFGFFTFSTYNEFK